MGAPPKKVASSGRVNKSKTPVLYLAESPETAMCEVRPSFKDYISVARFRLIKQIKLIDFRKIQIREKNKIHRELVSIFVDKILDAFSQPCNDPNDIEYAPTQYIAQFIRKKGFQGVIYKSSRNKKKGAFNIALFDPSLTECIDNMGVLYECTEQKYVFENITVLPTKIKKGGIGYNTKKWDDKDILQISKNMRLTYQNSEKYNC